MTPLFVLELVYVLLSTFLLTIYCSRKSSAAARGGVRPGDEKGLS